MNILQILTPDTLKNENFLYEVNNYSSLLILLGTVVFGTFILLISKKNKNDKKQQKGQYLRNNAVIKNSSLPKKEKEPTISLKPKPHISVENTTKIEPIEKANNKLKSTISGKIATTSSINNIETVKPEVETQSKIKHIGYNPLNIFSQSEPISYPYVLMPNVNSVIKLPRKGRSGRKGYKENDFKKYILKYFKNGFQLFDDRFILIKNNSRPFEPDFILIDEKNGLNLFLDIEVDEPYEGLNDISKRKATHFQKADINRNNALKNRGWVVIRFAEIQVHQFPTSCCSFIADVIKSIHSDYVISQVFSTVEKLSPIRQWTEQEALQWSINRYREEYLGIENFGEILTNDVFDNIKETEIGDSVENEVTDDKIIQTTEKNNFSKNKVDIINFAIHSNKFLSFTIDNQNKIVKPINTNDKILLSYCYIKNKQVEYSIYDINKVQIRNNYYTLKVAGPAIGIEKITNAINISISYNKFVRIKYTRASWSSMFIDEETGELIIDNIEAEESVRTINDVQLSLDVLAQEHIEAYSLNGNHITAYCNKREKKRTFRFDRIGEIEILNL